MPKTVGTRVMTSIYLRPEALEALRALAARRDVAMAYLMREAIDDLLAKHGQPVGAPARGRTATKAPSRGRKAPAKAK